MSLVFVIKKFRLKNFVTRPVIYLGIIVAVAATAWMGILLSNAHAASADDFVTTWKTDNEGTSGSSSITIPTGASNGYVYNYDVDWNNDGVFDELGVTGDVTHDYGTPGTYTVRIRGTFPQILFGGGGDVAKIINIDQWGTNVWARMDDAFRNAVNLESTATDAPNLTGVGDLSLMFYNATLFNGDLSGWDVSNVTRMTSMFYNARAFNSDLSGWNMSNVTATELMFAEAASFTSDLSVWDVSAVTAMYYMFSEARSFNSDLSGWDVSNVTSMSAVFNRASSFNSDLSGWDVSNVTNMSRMFYGASSFNGDLSGWDVSNVTNMSNMFMGASRFNGNISTWNISNVTNMWGLLGDIHLSTQTYDAILTAWAALPVQSSVYLSGGLSNYCSAAAAHASLVQDKGWVIYDDGMCGSNNRVVDSVDFTTYLGSKVMGVTGTAFLLDDSDIWASAGMNSLVSLNGAALPFCIDRTGYTVDDFIDYSADPALIGEQPPCYYFERNDDGYVASATRFELLLPSNFDTSARGTVSINGSPAFAFNQPAPLVGGGQLTGTPTIDKRPTFHGNTVAGSTVTVTVNSDPVICITTAGTQGEWSCTLPSVLPDGEHTATILVQMPSGQTQTFGPYSVMVLAANSGSDTNSGSSTGNTIKPQPLTNIRYEEGTGAITRDGTSGDIAVIDNASPTSITQPAESSETELSPKVSNAQGAWKVIVISALIVLSITAITLIVRRRFARDA